MLLLALLLPPLALYLIALGWLNGRPRPVMTAGTWDFAGLLFAASGFVLVGGPALLAAFDERSRQFWLLGQASTADTAPQHDALWTAVRVAYFVLVAGGAAVLLWRSRRLTAVYNVEAARVAAALEETFLRLNLAPGRSGDSFFLGKQTVETDAFPFLRHVTLRWEPADAPQRREVERELARVLAETAPSTQEPILGWALSLLGVTLLFLSLFAAALALLRNVLPHS